MCIMKQNLFALFLMVAMSLLSADQVFAANTGGCTSVGQSCTGGTCAQNNETGDIYCQASTQSTSSTNTGGCTSVGQSCTGGACAQSPDDGALYCKASAQGGTSAGSKCYDSFGGEVACTYNPATGTPLSGSTGSAATSPVPSTSGGSGSVTPSAGTSTASNRTSASVTGGTSRGLYIPRGSEVGLSEMSVTSLIRNLLNWLLYIVGFVAIIAFVISGMQYLMAGADEEMAKKGKANMTYAIIGVLVALSALIIIRAIQSVLSGSWMF